MPCITGKGYTPPVKDGFTSGMFLLYDLKKKHLLLQRPAIYGRRSIWQIDMFSFLNYM